MKNTVTAKRLKELREQKKVSQAEIAKYLDIERSTYTAYESGKSRPVRYLDKLSRYFNVSADYTPGITDSPLSQDVKFDFLSDDEKNFLTDYWELNDIGKKKLLSYLKDLLSIPSYRKKEDGIAV